MNNKFKQIFSNIYYAVSANLITLIISIVLNLIVPKVLGIQEYSYWQLYVFYISYVGFFHLGWIDGIYLKIGGEEYGDLNYKNLGTQFWYLLGFELIFVIFSLSTILFLNTGNNSNNNIIFIYLATAIVSIITILKTFIIYILQATNRIKTYAQISKNDRYLYILLLFSYLFMGGENFKVLILFDIISKTVIVIFGIYKIRKIILNRPSNFLTACPEIISNIQIGSKIMFSNIASMLIVGSVRYLVGQQWSLTVFGKLSFTLSISNMFLIFINSIGVVMYPLLRKSNKNNLKNIYEIIRSLFVPFTFALLIFYVPVREILLIWLPSYSESLYLMGYLFPIIVFEGRTNLLINTYLKTLRGEKYILLTNIIALLITGVAAVFSIFILKSLNVTVITILIGLMSRCIIGEKYLSSMLGISLDKELIIETFLTISFVITSISLNPLGTFLSYLIIFSIYLIFNQKNIKSNLFKSKNIILKKGS